MDDRHARKFQKELNAGLVALVLLAVLDASSEELYGYEIARRLQRANEGEALFKEGTVYPVLRALSAEGFLRSHIAPSDAGPPRRYYRITKEGPRAAQGNGPASGARRATSSIASFDESKRETAGAALRPLGRPSRWCPSSGESVT